MVLTQARFGRTTLLLITVLSLESIAPAVTAFADEGDDASPDRPPAHAIPDKELPHLDPENWKVWGGVGAAGLGALWLSRRVYLRRRWAAAAERDRAAARAMADAAETDLMRSLPPPAEGTPDLRTLQTRSLRYGLDLVTDLESGKPALSFSIARRLTRNEADQLLRWAGAVNAADQIDILVLNSLSRDQLVFWEGGWAPYHSLSRMPRDAAQAVIEGELARVQAPVGAFRDFAQRLGVLVHDAPDLDLRVDSNLVIVTTQEIPLNLLAVVEPAEFDRTMGFFQRLVLNRGRGHARVPRNTQVATQAFARAMGVEMRGWLERWRTSKTASAMISGADTAELSQEMARLTDEVFGDLSAVLERTGTREDLSSMRAAFSAPVPRPKDEGQIAQLAQRLRMTTGEAGEILQLHGTPGVASPESIRMLDRALTRSVQRSSELIAQRSASAAVAHLDEIRALGTQALAALGGEAGVRSILTGFQDRLRDGEFSLAGEISEARRAELASEIARRLTNRSSQLIRLEQATPVAENMLRTLEALAKSAAR